MAGCKKRVVPGPSRSRALPGVRALEADALNTPSQLQVASAIVRSSTRNYENKPLPWAGGVRQLAGCNHMTVRSRPVPPFHLRLGFNDGLEPVVSRRAGLPYQPDI